MRKAPTRLAIAKLLKDHETLIKQITAKGLEPENLPQLEALESRLHGEMVASLRNPLIETAARRLKNYLILIKLDRRITAPLALRTLREHVEILEACVAAMPTRRKQRWCGTSSQRFNAFSAWAESASAVGACRQEGRRS